MELEGFGASLVGQTTWVVCDDERHVWLPWEFLTGTSYVARILVRGAFSGGGNTTELRLLEAENNWNVVFAPQSARDWSLVATYLKASASGGSVLLTLDVGAARSAPVAFFGFLDGLVTEGRVLTRVFFCTHEHLVGGSGPDAVFFPPLAAHGAIGARSVLARLPARAGGTWHPPAPGEWDTLVAATAHSGLGIVATHVGEAEWRLFWHKPADSVPENSVHATRRAAAWIRSAGIVLERCVA